MLRYLKQEGRDTTGECRACSFLTSLLASRHYCLLPGVFLSTSESVAEMSKGIMVLSANFSCPLQDREQRAYLSWLPKSLFLFLVWKTTFSLVFSEFVLLDYQSALTKLRSAFQIDITNCLTSALALSSDFPQAVSLIHVVELVNGRGQV